ncbi:MAG TPA: RNA polymerase sigma-70 factor [Gemmatimonadales bacterium]|nr:RNA polymerase sigma-70 factor [Gemmatimonadales bacterium]
MTEPLRTPVARAVSELEWFDRLRAGDAQAFEALFRAYVEPLCAFADSYVDAPATAEEIVQDLFAKLWEQRERVARPQSVRAYLYAATRNRALNEMRRRRNTLAFVRRALRLDAARDDLPRPVTPEADLHAGEFAQAVARAVAELPRRCRETFTLTRDQGLSYAEAAAVLRISPKTVEIHVGRALALLREKLAPWLRP